MALFLNKLPLYLNHFLLLIALAARRCCTFNEVAHVLSRRYSLRRYIFPLLGVVLYNGHEGSGVVSVICA